MCADALFSIYPIFHLVETVCVVHRLQGLGSGVFFNVLVTCQFPSHLVISFFPKCRLSMG